MKHADIKNRNFGGVVELQAFEMVSPKLTLDSIGLTKVHEGISWSELVLPGLCVNVDAGFHVHVDISDVGLD